MTLNDLKVFFKNAIEQDISNELGTDIFFFKDGIDDAKFKEKIKNKKDNTFVIMIYDGVEFSKPNLLYGNWYFDFLILTEVKKIVAEETGKAHLKAEKIGRAIVKFLEEVSSDLCIKINFDGEFKLTPIDKGYFTNAQGQVLTLNIETEEA